MTNEQKQSAKEKAEAPIKNSIGFLESGYDCFCKSS